MVATERFGWATSRIEASGQKSAVGWAATLQAVTRVKLKQASKVKLWMPTRLLTRSKQKVDTCGVPKMVFVGIISSQEIR